MNTNHINDTFLLAMDQHQKGDLVQAEKTYRQIISTIPDHAGSIHNLGLVLYQRGNAEEAITMYQRALAIAPNYDEAYNNLGVALEGQGRLSEASNAYQQALRVNPDYAIAHNNLGDVLRKQGRLQEAENAYRHALRLEPRFAVAHDNLGKALYQQGCLQEAENAYREALRLEPRYAVAHLNLGNVLGEQGHIREAEHAYRQALRLQPDYARAYNNLGNILADQGRSHEAEEAFREALRLQPDYAEAYGNLVTRRKYDSLDHEDVTRILALLDRPNLPERDATHLHFALGKICDECGSYDQAFAHYQKANRIRHKTSGFDPSKLADGVNRYMETFSAELLRKRRCGSTSEIPVFIVGMMRSGTTLVEQIVACHPKVCGGGELKKMSDIIDRLPALVGGDDVYPECIEHIDDRTVIRLAEEYEAYAQRFSDDDTLRVTNKMPSNFLHLGLIALLFANARVIHCVRNPWDTCLSIYFQNFSDSNDYAYDLSDIGTYYRQYQRIMRHWRDVLPLRVYELQYEELVADLEGKARELIDFLDLAWDKRCLDFFQNKRPVRTASSWQVRQPIYTRSVNRWRSYEKYLGPLKQNLGFE